MTTTPFTAPRNMLFAACVAVLASTSAHADYVFTTIDYPGTTFTDVRGLNNNGAIVGYAGDGTNNFGFQYASGTFTPLPPAPGGLDTSAMAINDSGTITGSLGPSDGSSTTGFVLNGTTYQLFSYPGRTFTFARAINNAGLVTGYAENHDVNGNSINNLGFVYNPATGVFTDLIVPGSTFTIAQGINTANQIVGSGYVPGQGNEAFLRDPSTGTYSLFKLGGHQTRARGINDNGVITGFIYDSTTGLNSGWVGTSSGYQLLHATATDNTVGESINNSGQISGLFFDAVSTHGFIATPASLPAGTTSQGAYTFNVAVVADTPIYIDPAVAVGYDYKTGPGNPAFASVRLPIGFGDNIYTLSVNGKNFTLAAGDLFDFREHGVNATVRTFRVSGIEVAAGLDPGNPNAFPTQLTFTGSGQFTGTMTPLCANPKNGILKPCPVGR